MNLSLSWDSAPAGNRQVGEQGIPLTVSDPSPFPSVIMALVLFYSFVRTRARKMTGLSSRPETPKKRSVCETNPAFRAVYRPPPSMSEATSLVNPTNYRVCTTQPIDLAAHMVLLGESLGVIGQKLRDHDVSTDSRTCPGLSLFVSATGCRQAAVVRTVGTTLSHVTLFAFECIRLLILVSACMA